MITPATFCSVIVCPLGAFLMILVTLAASRTSCAPRSLRRCWAARLAERQRSSTTIGRSRALAMASRVAARVLPASNSNAGRSVSTLFTKPATRRARVVLPRPCAPVIYRTACRSMPDSMTAERTVVSSVYAVVSSTADGCSMRILARMMHASDVPNGTFHEHMGSAIHRLPLYPRTRLPSMTQVAPSPRCTMPFSAK